MHAGRIEKVLLAGFLLMAAPLLAQSPDAVVTKTPKSEIVPAVKQTPKVEIAPTTFFTSGNLVVTVEGCGLEGSVCTNIPDGTGGPGAPTGYGDNQAAPLTLFQFAPNGTSSVTYVNSLVLPQTGSGANVPVSGEYGSSSEGSIQLSGDGQYLTVMGYGVNAEAFNTSGTSADTNGWVGAAYGVPCASAGALGQSGNLTAANQIPSTPVATSSCPADTTATSEPYPYTPVPRVVALIDVNGNVNSAAAVNNVFDGNNPRSIYTLDGTTAYISGQGTSGDATGGVFYLPLGTASTAPTAITGLDDCIVKGCTTPTSSQDTRNVQIFDGTLYISVDSTSGKSNNRSFVGTLGDPPATSYYQSSNVPSGDLFGPTDPNGFGNSGGTGKVTISTGANSNGNSLNNSTTKVNGVALDLINLSPENYFFASPTVLYVADSGDPKNNSQGTNNSTNTNNIGDGGLQKWVNVSGTWTLEYTLYSGLNLVNNGNTDGTSGLYGLTGTVSGNNVYLYATNFVLSDLDQTYLYGITDNLTFTTASQAANETFTLLATAPWDSNFKGVSFAPKVVDGDVEVTSVPSGLSFTSAGTGCAPGTDTTPITLAWTPASSCTLSVTSPQSGGTGVQYAFASWENGSTSTSRTVTAPSTTATYTATFTTEYLLTTSATAGGTVSAGGYFASGQNAIVTATPASGYYFVDFSGTTSSTSNPLTIDMTSPETITANFAPQVQQTITFSKQAPSSATYGSSFTVAASATSGLAVSYTSSGACSNSGATYTMISGTGNCSVIANQAGGGQYAAAQTVTETVTATKAPLTVTDNQSMNQGAAVPTLVPTYSTFVNGDTAASLTGAPALSTTATSSSPAGMYPIAVGVGTLTSANYAFTAVNGTMSVVSAPAITLTVSATISGSAVAGYTASVKVTNTSTGTANNVTLTTGTLGSSSASSGVPNPIGTLAAGASTTVLVGFPGTAGADGAASVYKFAGTFTGGTFSGSARTTLP